MIRLATHLAVSLVLFCILGWALHTLPSTPAGLTGQTLDALPESGVKNPVTAVLLNFRGYDTLLEVAVLLLALAALCAISPSRTEDTVIRSARHPVIWTLLRLVIPFIIMGSGYLLWIGAFAPGGAFQAGAMLSGGLVLMLIAGVPGVFRLCGNRFMHVLGLAVFLVMALWPLWTGNALLQYPPGRAKMQILLIECAATLSIACILAALFIGGRPFTESKERR